MDNAYLAFYQEVWKKVVPSLDMLELSALEFFVERYPNNYTAYSLSRISGLNLSTAYRVVKRLAYHRLILPTLNGGYRATVKGALVLAVHTGDLKWITHAKKIWGVEADNKEFLSFLVILGEALNNFGFTIREAFICHLFASISYIIAFVESRSLSSIDALLLSNALRFLSKTPYRKYINFEQLEKICQNNELRIKYGICSNLGSFLK